nr:hypothetical protein BaRGS_005760 [Batillaria attramentaria]
MRMIKKALLEGRQKKGITDKPEEIDDTDADPDLLKDLQEAAKRTKGGNSKAASFGLGGSPPLKSGPKESSEEMDVEDQPVRMSNLLERSLRRLAQKQ